jgi:hypothetical protein
MSDLLWPDLDQDQAVVGIRRKHERIRLGPLADLAADASSWGGRIASPFPQQEVSRISFGVDPGSSVRSIWAFAAPDIRSRSAEFRIIVKYHGWALIALGAWIAA